MINVTAPNAHFDCVCSYLKGAWFSVLTNLSPDLIAQNLFLNDLPKNLVQSLCVAESVGILDVVENLLDECAGVEVV